MRQLAILTFSFLMITGCSNTQQRQEEENIAVVKGMFEAFNRHDWQDMADHYADNATFLDPSFGIDYVSQTKEELVKKYSDMEAVFPDIHDEVVTLFARENRVAVEFVSTGKSGDSLSFRLPISCVLTIENGKIIKDANYYNNCQ
jgi:ketosteroid isomerase-like protein